MKETLTQLAAARHRLDAPQAKAVRPGLGPEAIRALLRPWSRCGHILQVTHLQL